MNCDEVRAALSARLDGEPSGVDDDVVDAHVDACADCRAWFDRAVALNRSLLMGPAHEPGDARDDGSPPPGSAPAAGPEPLRAAHDVPEHPDLEALSERILSTVEPERRRRARFWMTMSVGGRVVLIILGVLYVIWGVGLLIDAGAAASGTAAGAPPGTAPGEGTAAIRDWADAARLAARGATEVHGGIGITEELGLHIWFKRISFGTQLFGGPTRLREEAASLQELGAAADDRGEAAA